MEGDLVNAKHTDLIFVYPLHDSLYLNITNRCPNACVFCIRDSKHGGVGYNLWLEHEPTTTEILAAISDVKGYKEVVFCGYGEPLMRPEVVIAIAAAIKQRMGQESSSLKIRINTNGLADLFLGYDVLPQLKGLIDTISISLNAHNSEEYLKLTRSKYGTQAFPALLDFSKRSILYIPKVVLTAVRHPGVDIAAITKIAADIGAELRIREYLL